MKKNNAMVMNRKNNGYELMGRVCRSTSCAPIGREAPGKRFGTASAAYNLIFAPVGENR